MSGNIPIGSPTSRISFQVADATDQLLVEQSHVISVDNAVVHLHPNRQEDSPSLPEIFAHGNNRNTGVALVVRMGNGGEAEPWQVGDEKTVVLFALSAIRALSYRFYPSRSMLVISAEILHIQGIAKRKIRVVKQNRVARMDHFKLVQLAANQPLPQFGQAVESPGQGVAHGYEEAVSLCLGESYKLRNVHVAGDAEARHLPVLECLEHPQAFVAGQINFSFHWYHVCSPLSRAPPGFK